MAAYPFTPTMLDHTTHRFTSSRCFLSTQPSISNYLCRTHPFHFSTHLLLIYIQLKSLGIDFESTRIRLLALCGTTALQTVQTMPTPPSMDFAMLTTMLEHQNTDTSSTIHLLANNKPHMPMPSKEDDPPSSVIVRMTHPCINI